MSEQSLRSNAIIGSVKEKQLQAANEVQPVSEIIYKCVACAELVLMTVNTLSVPKIICRRWTSGVSMCGHRGVETDLTRGETVTLVTL